MITPDAFWITHRRDEDGKPIPGGRVVTDPNFTKNMDVARDFATWIRDNPTADLKPLKPWIWVSNSIAAMETVEHLRKFFDQRHEKKNSELRAKLADLKELLRAQEFDAQKFNAELTGLLLHVGAEIDENGKLVFPTDKGRYSDAAIAGKHEIARGRPKKAWMSPVVSFLAIAGSGTLMALGLGVITGQMDFTNMQFGPTAICFTVGVSLAACVSAGVKPAYFKQGQFGFFHSFSGKKKWLTPVAIVGLAAATVLTIVAVQSKVEQVGIFKGLQADSSLHSVALTKSELFLVSLIMVVSVMVYYVWASFTDGFEFSAGDKIEALRSKAIEEALASDEGKRLTEVVDQITPVRERIAALQADIKATEALITEDYTDAEKMQLDDASKACIDYSLKAEEACGFKSSTDTESSESWWDKIKAGRSRSG